MLDPAVLGFVRAALLPPPARILEVGAGQGELAAALRDAGWEVTAIDPAVDGAAGVQPVALNDLRAEDAAFDAAVAVVSLHHVRSLGPSCERLGAVVRPGGTLVVDEFDVARFDTRAAAWQTAQRAAAGMEAHDHGAAAVADLQAHMHPVAAIRAALAPWFAVGEPVRGPYLYRWDLDPALRTVEERLVSAGGANVRGLGHALVTAARRANRPCVAVRTELGASSCRIPACLVEPLTNLSHIGESRPREHGASWVAGGPP